MRRIVDVMLVKMLQTNRCSLPVIIDREAGEIISLVACVCVCLCVCFIAEIHSHSVEFFR